MLGNHRNEPTSAKHLCQNPCRDPHWFEHRRSSANRYCSTDCYREAVRSASESRRQSDAGMVRRRQFLAGIAQSIAGAALWRIGESLWKVGESWAFGPSLSVQSKQTVLTPERLVNAYTELEHLGTLDRDGLALAVARKFSTRRIGPGAPAVDTYIESVLGRLLSHSLGGRSATLGTVLLLIHPELGLPIDEALADRLLRVSAHALSSDSFLYPDAALLVAGFAGDRLGSSACLDFAESVVKKQHLRPTPLNYAPTLYHWFNTGRQIPLSTLYPVSDLIPMIERRLPISSPIISNPAKALERARATVKKPLSTWSPLEAMECDHVIRYLADQWTQRL